MPEALELTVTAPVVSFRNPLYDGLQVALPCPPPSTVGGMLAAAAGGWNRVPLRTRFGMAFYAAGSGRDLETYHPLGIPGSQANATIKEREFLALVTLTVWLVDDIAVWLRAFRRPIWPLRLGRSQDLVAITSRRVELEESRGRQGRAVVPFDVPDAAGTAMRLTTVVSDDRSRFAWDSYRYAAAGTRAEIDTGLATRDGQAVAMLPPVHPNQLILVT
ncbi:CRISPR-associated protein Cas5 [Actinomadura decatromicini]|uniref:CRISPR-associated protein Cas5 n=1 Tax=Actinomadura decatromicini TaxID=2604572 RepID=A0A5D3FX15_9ACTN|nr:CRISPR-associated protein Cas5 [Actinomadura decatromicini]TYK52598.1 CRISPR-associated protein Cas5 [Actinomadura decatromicini]